MSTHAVVLVAALALGALSCSRDASPPAPGPAASGSGSTQPTTATTGELKAGDVAPEFALPGSDGKPHKLSDHVGKEAVVVAWFPKAFTGG